MHAPPLGRISQHLSSRPHAVLSHVVTRGAPAPDAAVLFRTAYRRWMASLGTADELSRWSLAPLISPARWQLTLCSDQTRLSHSSAIPKQQMGRAFSSIEVKQVCRALVGDSRHHVRPLRRRSTGSYDYRFDRRERAKCRRRVCLVTSSAAHGNH